MPHWHSEGRSLPVVEGGLLIWLPHVSCVC